MPSLSLIHEFKTRRNTDGERKTDRGVRDRDRETQRNRQTGRDRDRYRNTQSYIEIWRFG